MDTAKVGRVADKVRDSAQRMMSYAHTASSAAGSHEFFGGNFGSGEKKLDNAVKRMKAELLELTELVAELNG